MRETGTICQSGVSTAERSQMALLQTRLNEVSTEVTRASRHEVETLKERCKKTEVETINLFRRVQNAQECANRIPELERELKLAVFGPRKGRDFALKKKRCYKIQYLGDTRIQNAVRNRR